MKNIPEKIYLDLGEDWYTSDGEHVRPDYWMEIPAIPVK